MSKLALPKLVSIDLDGTLVDSVPDLAWAADRSMEAMGYPVRGEAKVRNWVGNGVPMLLRRALGDGNEDAVTDEQILAQARGHFDRFYRTHFATDSRVYDSVFETLQWFAERDIPLALITNKPIGFTEPMMIELELAQYFRWTLGGDSLEKAKPDPMPLLLVASEAKLDPSQCLHIGDSSTDVKAAKNAGFASVAVSFGYNHGQPISDSNPDVVIDHWNELPLVFS